jgi:hypothetical protein
MKKKTIVFGIVAVLLLLAAAYFWGPSSVPPGQASLLTLTAANFSEFEKSFDADSDDLRLVLLFSPT